LSLGRAASETVPIIFTARLPDSVLSPVMALPYHLFVMATEIIFYEETRPIQCGGVLRVFAFRILLFGDALRKHADR
ncbi:MAG: phosphate ABC transporter, permease protein PstA, partial [Candidatus Bipolaricaulota bacterium]|nr:phosphate ABC transporter, permease protein PstA [Candidatus Bipolaricaulota bacterium]